MKIQKLESPRHFRFNGYFNKPYYGQGTFTKGEIYHTTRLRFYIDHFECGMQMDPEAVFEDDNGKMTTEELKYFTEVMNEY
jgi:hypothetical protein